MKNLLDSRGLATLYKAQVRPHLDYATLTWTASPHTHLTLLDKVQRRAKCWIAGACQQGEEAGTLESLQHCRRVTALNKTQLQWVPHLTPLVMPGVCHNTPQEWCWQVTAFWAFPGRTSASASAHSLPQRLDCGTP